MGRLKVRTTIVLEGTLGDLDVTMTLNLEASDIDAADVAELARSATESAIKSATAELPEPPS